MGGTFAGCKGREARGTRSRDVDMGSLPPVPEEWFDVVTLLAPSNFRPPSLDWVSTFTRRFTHDGVTTIEAVEAQWRQQALGSSSVPNMVTSQVELRLQQLQTRLADAGLVCVEISYVTNNTAI